VIAGLAYGEDEELVFLAMEHLPDSLDLDQVLERSGGRLPWAEATQHACELLEALDFLHQQRVIHRDVKPKNVLLSRRGVVLIDFDLAKQLDPELEDSGELDLSSLAEDRSQSGLTGTPLYMSPERIAGGEVNVQSDLYAAGLVLFVLLTGKLPSDYARAPRTIRELRCVRQLHPPQLRSALGCEVPTDLDEWLRRALHPSPSERFPSAAEMYEALTAILLLHG